MSTNERAASFCDLFGFDPIKSENSARNHFLEIVNQKIVNTVIANKEAEAEKERLQLVELGKKIEETSEISKLSDLRNQIEKCGRAFLDIRSQISEMFTLAKEFGYDPKPEQK